MSEAMDYSGDLGDQAPPTASGRHMIGTFVALAEHARVSARSFQAAGDDEEADHFTMLSDIFDTAARCILNEAARADRAERS